jgi:hypothetical protein
VTRRSIYASILGEPTKKKETAWTRRAEVPWMMADGNGKQSLDSSPVWRPRDLKARDDVRRVVLVCFSISYQGARDQRCLRGRPSSAADGIAALRLNLQNLFVLCRFG